MSLPQLMPLLSAGGASKGAPLTVSVFDPGITTGVLRAQRRANGGWWLKDTHAWDDAQLMLNLHVSLVGSDVIIVERLPTTMIPALGATVAEIGSAVRRLGAGETIHVAPGVWKPWIQKRKLPPSWLRILPTLRTPHERDCLRMLCWWAATHEQLGTEEWNNG